MPQIIADFRRRFITFQPDVGNVLFDQLAFMHRCGFDAFEVQKDPDADRFAKALTTFSVRYQRAADDAQTALELRHKARRNVAQEGR